MILKRTIRASIDNAFATVPKLWRVKNYVVFRSRNNKLCKYYNFTVELLRILSLNLNLEIEFKKYIFNITLSLNYILFKLRKFGNGGKHPFFVRFFKISMPRNVQNILDKTIKVFLIKINTHQHLSSTRSIDWCTNCDALTKKTNFENFGHN